MPGGGLRCHSAREQRVNAPGLPPALGCQPLSRRPWPGRLQAREGPWHPCRGGCPSLQGVESVRKEIDESVLGQTGPYRRPERLRRRKELSGGKSEGEKVFEPNE